MYTRLQQPAHPRLPWPLADALSAGLLLSFVVLVALWFDDHGTTWDEPIQMAWGDAKLDFYLAVCQGEKHLGEAREIRGSLVHPGFFDILGAAVRRVSPLGDYSTMHLLCSAFGGLGAVAVWLTARRLGGPVAGLFAAVCLLCLPRYFGHLWFNSKDIPFAALMAWAGHALTWAVLRFPKVPWWWGLWLGGLAGAALGVRLAALLIFGYYGLTGALYVLGQQPLKAWAGAGAWQQLGRLAVPAVFALGVAFVVVLPFWPGLWVDAGDNPAGDGGLGGAISQAHEFQWIGLVRFNGEQVMSNALPRTYLVQWLFMTIPLSILAVLLGGGILATLDVRRHGLAGWLEGHRLAILLSVVMVAFPLVYVTITRPVLYDGLRHFLFILPPLALLAGLSASHLLRLAEHHSRRLGQITGAAFALGVMHIGTWYLLAHPFSYIYFNAFTGGVAQAQHRFETDYWGLSFRPLVEQLQAALEQAYPDGVPEPVVIHLPRHIAPWMAQPFAPDHWEFTHELDGAHFAMSYTRMDQHRPFIRKPLAAAVFHDGALLAGAWVLEPLKPTDDGDDASAASGLSDGTRTQAETASPE